MYAVGLEVSVYKSYINDLPVGFNNYFKKRSDFHDSPTKQVYDLNSSFNKKKILLTMLFELAGPRLWNSVPQSKNTTIKNCLILPKSVKRAPF